MASCSTAPNWPCNMPPLARSVGGRSSRLQTTSTQGVGGGDPKLASSYQRDLAPAPTRLLAPCGSLPNNIFAHLLAKRCGAACIYSMSPSPQRRLCQAQFYQHRSHKPGRKGRAWQTEMSRSPSVHAWVLCKCLTGTHLNFCVSCGTPWSRPRLQLLLLSIATDAGST